MRKKWWLFLLIPPGIVLFTWLFGLIVMHLWNWLLPGLFGWHTITFWQALGMLVLCRILFGGFGNSGNRGGAPSKRKSKLWEAMPPEEREAIRQEMRARCGGFTAPGSETKEPA